MDGGSMTSEVALRDPFDPGVTLVGDFLHLPYLEHVITDSHFARRDRPGRLVVFVARLRGEGVADVAGLEIGRASCRERVCQSVLIWVVAVSLKEKEPIV